MAQLNDTMVQGDLRVTGKIYSTAIGNLDSEKTSTDGTNVQVKVTEADGKISAVNITTDTTANRNEGVYYVAGTTDYPAWVANHAYAVNDNAISGGKAYYCKTAHTSGSSFDSSKWTAIATPVIKGTITGVTALYTGIKIALKWPITGGTSSTYLNINNLGNVYIRRNDGNITTHLPANSVSFLAYDGTYWRWADYDSNTNNWVTTMGAYCDTAAETQAKVATSTSTVYTAGETFLIRFTKANTYNGKITLNINSQDAKDVWINGAVSSSSNKTLPAGEHWCHYDGSVFHIWTDGTAQFTKLKAGTFTGNVTGDVTGNAATATTASDYNTSSGTIKTALDGKADGKCFYNGVLHVTDNITRFLKISFSGRVGRCSAIVLIGANNGDDSSAFRLSWFYDGTNAIGNFGKELFSTGNLSKRPLVYYDSNSIYIGLSTAGNWGATISVMLSCENPDNVTYDTVTRSEATGNGKTNLPLNWAAVYTDDADGYVTFSMIEQTTRMKITYAVQGRQNGIATPLVIDVTGTVGSDEGVIYFT